MIAESKHVVNKFTSIQKHVTDTMRAMNKKTEIP